MKLQFTVRKSTKYSIPFPKNLIIKNPELAVVKFGISRTVDIGKLCYSDRSTLYGKATSKRCSVSLSSLSSQRIVSVRRLLLHISSVAELNLTRMPTLHDRFSRMVVFINWADREKWPDVLENEDALRPALHAYLDFIRDRVSRNELTNNSGARQQCSVIQAFSEFFALDVGRGLNLLRVDQKMAERTIPPSEASKARVLSLCESIFDGISDLILDRLEFPYRLELPSYLSFPNNSLWLFPTTAWFKTPKMIEEKSRASGFFYQEGRLSTNDEIIKCYPRSSMAVRKRSAERIHLANQNPSHPSRFHIGMQAFNCYIILFIAETGMNWAQVVELNWVDNFQAIPSRQGFRGIKWRAGGKEVFFELPASSMPRFSRLLSLRKYLLRGQNFDHLFFTKTGLNEPAWKVRTSLERTYPMLRRIDPSLDSVMPRKWRAAKSDWLIRNEDLSMAALILQTSEKTVANHYSQGSETRYQEEMSSFFNGISNVIESENQKHHIDIAVGKCSTYGAPSPIAPKFNSLPDCKNFQGCLFCKNFAVHPDISDVKKLLSCRYVVSLTSSLLPNAEAFEEFLEPIVIKIDEIIAKINAINPQVVSRAKKEVDQDGDLDLYWSSKAEMLMTIGV